MKKTVIFIFLTVTFFCLCACTSNTKQNEDSITSKEETEQAPTYSKLPDVTCTPTPTATLTSTLTPAITPTLTPTLTPIPEVLPTVAEILEKWEEDKTPLNVMLMVNLDGVYEYDGKTVRVPKSDVIHLRISENVAYVETYSEIMHQVTTDSFYWVEDDTGVNRKYRQYEDSMWYYVSTETGHESIISLLFSEQQGTVEKSLYGRYDVKLVANNLIENILKGYIGEYRSEKSNEDFIVKCSIDKDLKLRQGQGTMFFKPTDPDVNYDYYISAGIEPDEAPIILPDGIQYATEYDENYLKNLSPLGTFYGIPFTPGMSSQIFIRDGWKTSIEKNGDLGFIEQYGIPFVNEKYKYGGRNMHETLYLFAQSLPHFPNRPGNIEDVEQKGVYGYMFDSWNEYEENAAPFVWANGIKLGATIAEVTETYGFDYEEEAIGAIGEYAITYTLEDIDYEYSLTFTFLKEKLFRVALMPKCKHSYDGWCDICKLFLEEEKEREKSRLNYIQMCTDCSDYTYMILNLPKDTKDVFRAEQLQENLVLENEGLIVRYADSLVEKDKIEEVMDYFRERNILKPMRYSMKGRDVYFGRDEHDPKYVYILLETNSYCKHYIKIDIEDKNEMYNIADLLNTFVRDM